MGKLGDFPNSLQDLSTPIFGQVEVKQNQIRPGSLSICALPAHKRYRRLPVFNDREFILQALLSERLSDEEHVTGVVLSQKDLNRRGGQLCIHMTSHLI